MLTSTHDAILRKTDRAPKGFLKHFDTFLERETNSCNNAATCTPIRMETRKKLARTMKYGNQVTMTQSIPSHSDFR